MEKLSPTGQQDDFASVGKHEVELLRDEIVHLEKANSALQEIVDALASLPDLSQFVPAALRVVARVFEAKDCAYYEHRRGELVRLRYWFFDGRVLGPEEIRKLADDHEYSDMKRREAGFEVPDSYLGVPFRLRTLASIVDHDRATSEDPSWDALCKSRGWYKELSVPLVVAGEADGALVIQRGYGTTYLPSEISLAERLAKQLALAMEVDRLSGMARQTTVVHERQLTAQQRADELSLYTEALKQSIDSLAGEEDLHGFIGRVLTIAAERLRAPIVEYWIGEGATRTRLVLTCRDGVIYEGSDDPDDPRVRGVEVPTDVARGDELSRQVDSAVYDMLENRAFRDHAEGFGMKVEAWCRERGVQKMMVIPLLRSERSYGVLCVFLPKDRKLGRPQVDLARSLAQQVSLAVRMTELADASKQAALSQQKEQAAQQRSAELSKANQVLRSTLEQLSDERDLESFPKAILKEAMQQLDARDGIIFLFDKRLGTLQATEYLSSPGSSTGPTDAFSKPFSADSVSAWTAILAKRQPIVFDVERDESLLLPGESTWHRGRGNRSVVIAPIFVGGEPYGFFGTALQTLAEDVSEVDLELMQALTHQAALAIQLTRLADESKQAALAQERERDAQERAAEFANANEVLRSTLDQLAAEQDLHSFPRSILREAMNQAEAKDGLILVFDEQNDTLTRTEYLADRDLAPKSEMEFTQPFSASRTPAWAALIGKRSPIIFDIQQDAAMLLPGLADWHRKRGNRSIIAAAMFIDSKPYGYFGVTLAEPAVGVSKVKAELIYALAQQATLAIQLMQLAEASQEAAIMVERQQVVAQERANMAREIHDRLAQGYAAILLQQHTLRRTMHRKYPDSNQDLTLIEQLDDIERTSKENLAEARRTMDELRVDPFGVGNFEHALRRCVETMSLEQKIAVKLRIDENLPSFRRYVESDLCRVVVEALTNAHKHARVKAASVDVVKAGEGIFISIEDDGIGFTVENTEPSFGISSMHERAARAGANLVIVSSPGKGTKVQMMVKR